MTRRILSIIGLLLIGKLCMAQVMVFGALDSTRMMIGDHMKLHLAVNHHPDVKVLKIDWSKIEEVEEIEVIDPGNIDTIKSGNEFVLQQDLIFTVFDSGAFFIPKIPITFIQNGQTSVKMTNELMIEVSVPPVDSVGLEPIKPIILEPVKLEDFLPFIFGILGLALLIGLFYYYRRSQQKEPPPAPAILIPAHEIASKKLEELKMAKLWQQGKIKEYQSQLTFIVREYLENRYGTQALESTTGEIIAQLEPIALSSDWKKKLREMLQLADLVKFAKAEPPIETHDRLMGYAEDFVRTTKAKEVVIESSEENND